jgi:aryl-alcohol dehydrogenase-like predicted oxidoreductase
MNIGTRDVGSIGLGTSQFAFKDGSERDSIRTIHAALDSGIRLIDTALAYTRPGIDSYAESLVRTALAQKPTPDALVATKGGHWRDGDDFPVDGSPATLRRHCEFSLKSLGVDRIDLYQLHHEDPNVPLAESVDALRSLQEEGKISRIGLSNVSVAQIDEARALAEISTVQNRASFSRPGDLATARRCAELEITYLAYMPLDGPESDAAEHPDSRGTIAERHGVSRQQVSLAWLLAQGANILPLVGSSRPATIEDSAQAPNLELTAEELQLLDSESAALIQG